MLWRTHARRRVRLGHVRLGLAEVPPLRAAHISLKILVKFLAERLNEELQGLFVAESVQRFVDLLNSFGDSVDVLSSATRRLVSRDSDCSLDSKMQSA